MESPSIRQFTGVDDAAIFIDDTFDAETVRSISGTSPSAVVMLSPQRMPVDADGNSLAAMRAVTSSSPQPSDCRHHKDKNYDAHYHSSSQPLATAVYTIGTSSSTRKRRSSTGRRFFNDLTNHVNPLMNAMNQSPSVVGQKLSFSNCSTPIAQQRTKCGSIERVTVTTTTVSSHHIDTNNLLTTDDDNKSHHHQEVNKESSVSHRSYDIVRCSPQPNPPNSLSSRSTCRNSPQTFPIASCLKPIKETTDNNDINSQQQQQLYSSDIRLLDDDDEELIEQFVPLLEYERLEKDRNRYRTMYRYQAQLCDDLYKKERAAQESLQEKIIEIVALSSRNEESKRYIRQMKKEMLNCRERTLPFFNRKLDGTKLERELKDTYENMMQLQHDHFAKVEQGLREELAAQQALLNDYKVASSLGKSSESLLRASYQKNTQMYGELCRARSEWNNELDHRMDLERQLETVRKEKRDAELELCRERRRNFSREDALQRDIHMLQEEIIQLTSDLLELRLNNAEEEEHLYDDNNNNYYLKNSNEESTIYNDEHEQFNDSKLMVVAHMDEDEVNVEEENEIEVERSNNNNDNCSAPRRKWSQNDEKKHERPVSAIHHKNRKIEEDDGDHDPLLHTQRPRQGVRHFNGSPPN